MLCIYNAVYMCVYKKNPITTIEMKLKLWCEAPPPWYTPQQKKSNIIASGNCIYNMYLYKNEMNKMKKEFSTLTLTQFSVLHIKETPYKC